MHIGQTDFIRSNFVRFFFSKLSGKLVTDVKDDQFPRFVHSTLMRKQWTLTKISVYIHVPFDHAVLSNNHLDKQCNF